MTTIDLNCDMGESFGAWTMGADEAVMPWVTSVNVACGFHAGDPTIMRRTVEAAVAAGVAVGAHVGLPDLAGFGRRAMAVTARQVHDFTLYQVGALDAIARACGTRVTHMKPHGALYHMAEDDPELAQALAEASHRFEPALRLVGRAGGRLVEAGRDGGLAVAHEVFADRRYLPDGRLAPRGQPGAVIDDAEQAACQAVDLALHGRVTAVDGSRLDLPRDTLCIHGDRADAAVFARTLNEALRRQGVVLASLAAR